LAAGGAAPLVRLSLIPSEPSEGPKGAAVLASAARARCIEHLTHARKSELYPDVLNESRG
jgi:hypothetical protein